MFRSISNVGRVRIVAGTRVNSSYSQTVELLRAARRGNREALARIATKYHDRLLARIRIMMGPEARRRAESGDFLQTVFVDLCRHAPVDQLDDEESLLGFLTAVASNNIKSALRKKRERALESFSATICLANANGRTPSADAHHAETLRLLVIALERLREDHRTVIELRNLEQLPYREIAERMGKSVGAIHMLHARAILKLGELVKARQP